MTHQLETMLFGLCTSTCVVSLTGPRGVTGPQTLLQEMAECGPVGDAGEHHGKLQHSTCLYRSRTMPLQETAEYKPVSDPEQVVESAVDPSEGERDEFGRWVAGQKCCWSLLDPLQR